MVREVFVNAKDRCWMGGRSLGLVVAGLLLWTSGLATAVELGDLNIDESRIPSWGSTRAGVEGGLPDSSTWPVHQTLSPGWSAAQLQSAIDGASARCAADAQCPAGTVGGYVVQLPAETRDVGNGAPVFLKSNVVVRGQGPDRTRLRVNAFSGNGTSCVNAAGLPGISSEAFFILCSRHQGFDNVDLVWSGGGPARGSTQFTLNTGDPEWNPNDYEPGNYILLNLTTSNSNASPFITRSPNGRELFFQHMARITARSGNRITVDRALRLDWSRNTPQNCNGTCYQVRGFQALTNAGVEDMLIEGEHLGPIGGSPPQSVHPDNNTSSELIAIQAAANVWVHNVTARWSVAAPISVNTSVNVSIVGSEVGPTLWSRCLNGSLFGTCTTANAGEYTIALANGAADGLYANNILRGHAIGFRLRGPQNGNVIAYNYHNAQPADQRPFGGRSGASHGLAFVHGYFPHMNLVEGNDSNVVLAMVSDCFWGRNGPNTFYRNRASADPSENAFEADESGWFKTESQGANCSQGNVLIGNNAFAYTDSVGANYFRGGKNGMSNGIMTDLWFEYNLARDNVANQPGRGFNVVDSGSVGLDCGNGTGTCARTNDHTYERNFEGPAAPAAWSAVNVPNSLYFTSIEDWESQTGSNWCQEACSWTAQDGIGAFGDDAGRSFCSIPAELRFQGASCSPRVGGLEPLPIPFLREVQAP